MNFLAVPWLWLYCGAFLMLAEILAPGFVIFFFGLAAATVGGLLFLLSGTDAWQVGFTGQLALFSLFSVVYLVTLRRWLMGTFFGDGKAHDPLNNEFAGRLGTVVERIRPEHPGRILLGDAEWSAAADCTLEPGAEVKVVSRENLTFRVAPIS